jgi:hypothetical protein
MRRAQVVVLVIEGDCFVFTRSKLRAACAVDGNRRSAARVASDDEGELRSAPR